MSSSSDVNALTAKQRLHFYEVFAHNITVAIRGVWSDDALADAEKVEQIKWINEILHRVTGKIWVLRLKTLRHMPHTLLWTLEMLEGSNQQFYSILFLGPTRIDILRARQRERDSINPFITQHPEWIDGALMFARLF